VLGRIGGVVAGVVVTFLCVQGAELITHKLYPPPPGTNMHDFAQVKAFVATLPPLAFALVLGGWLVGTFLGTFTAARIGRSRVPAYFIGVLLLIAGVVNAIVIPQPMWFSVASLFVYGTMTIAGAAAGKPAVVEGLRA